MKPDARAERELRDLSDTLRPRVRALIEACPVPLSITSAWRSRAEQQRLYDGWRARRPGFNPANPPGMSRHEDTDGGRPAANAADLDYPNGSGRAFGVAWAHQHAARFGLHFPIRREDWHVESNGRPFTPPQEDDDMKPDEREALFETRDLLRALVAPRRPDKKDTDPDAISLGDVLTDDGD